MNLVNLRCSTSIGFTVLFNRYVPSFLPPPSSSRGREPEKKKEDERPKEREKGKPRNIDNFMEEIKRDQELREKRNQERGQKPEGHHVENSAPSTRFDELPDEFDPFGKLPGIFDDVDPQTTNLYVGNLSPQVDETFLLRTFGRFGPIASVKIMWPRTEDERKRQRNCGFVAFMNRADGQDAMDEMQGVVVYEYELKIGWGKSVSLPGQALPAPPPGQMAIRSKEGATVILSGPAGPPITSVPNQGSELVGNNSGQRLELTRKCGVISLSARKSFNIVPRCSGSSQSEGGADESKDSETTKVPFGYSRKDVLLIGVGVTLLGIGLKSGLEGPSF
ncbi:Protein rrc1 [Ranunculus cassubicifolius]